MFTRHKEDPQEAGAAESSLLLFHTSSQRYKAEPQTVNSCSPKPVTSVFIGVNHVLLFNEQPQADTHESKKTYCFKTHALIHGLTCCIPKLQNFFASHSKMLHRRGSPSRIFIIRQVVSHLCTNHHLILFYWSSNNVFPQLLSLLGSSKQFCPQTVC